MTDEEIKKAINQISGLSGMTVNERLCVTGLFDEFEKAIKSDQDKARRILELLLVDNPSIDKIVK